MRALLIVAVAAALSACGDPRCNPNNCNGCCTGSGVCQAGTSSLECGTGGKQCFACPGIQKCTGGTCVDGAGGGGGGGGQTTTCSSSNCNGCCSGTTCLSGVDRTACGIYGQACQDCNTGKLICFQHACRVCGPSTCAGCCGSLYGDCYSGTDDGLCGRAGEACHGCPSGTSFCLSTGVCY